MEEQNNIEILQVSTDGAFEYQDYSQKDTALLSGSYQDTAFTSSTDYIEFYIYDGSKNLLTEAS